MKFEEKLITLRKSRGWSQEDLGNQMGVSRQSISKWESGQTSPEMSKLIDLSRIFEISVDELICIKAEKEEKNEPTIVNEVKVNLKPTNILLIVSCALIVIGLISSVIFYFIGKKESKVVDSILYITYTAKYSDNVEIVEIYSFDDEGICLSASFYNKSINNDDHKKILKQLNSTKDKNKIDNLIIEDLEITWQEKRYDGISKKDIVEEKEESLEEKENFIMKEL